MLVSKVVSRLWEEKRKNESKLFPFIQQGGKGNSGIKKTEEQKGQGARQVNKEHGQLFKRL